eukprot:CAMPEP_0204009490 /NCGR_PEP_ID=MMETSP0360-20130528/21881_1 /ASSEMBLY_ACC=CAM_ASM_000342 /TAXON_ID=268821 /ORGANISM="Scrippsiella Hangoei, Strain SHTV-5" /LENGTH=276 /DNA_ID=CAMNT_0050951859 /DNA_START=132 /DNA_END=959 /DNA_ORIENTATION=+
MAHHDIGKLLEAAHDGCGAFRVGPWVKDIIRLPASLHPHSFPTNVRGADHIERVAGHEPRVVGGALRLRCEEVVDLGTRFEDWPGHVIHHHHTVLKAVLQVRARNQAGDVFLRAIRKSNAPVAPRLQSFQTRPAIRKRWQAEICRTQINPLGFREPRVKRVAAKVQRLPSAAGQRHVAVHGGPPKSVLKLLAPPMALSAGSFAAPIAGNARSMNPIPLTSKVVPYMSKAIVTGHGTDAVKQRRATENGWRVNMEVSMLPTPPSILAPTKSWLRKGL